jgi:hypothetical protein
MEINKFKLMFGKSVNIENQMEIALFYDNKLFLSSGQATYLERFLPNKEVPENWKSLAKKNQNPDSETSENTLSKDLIVSQKDIVFNNNTLVPASDLFSYSFNHIETGEQLEYSLPRFKQDENKKKNITKTFLLETLNKEFKGVCVTNRNNAGFFFGVGGRSFLEIPKILKPLYYFRARSAILAIDMDESNFLMGWRCENIDGIQQPTYFRMFKPVI